MPALSSLPAPLPDAQKFEKWTSVCGRGAGEERHGGGNTRARHAIPRNCLTYPLVGLSSLSTLPSSPPFILSIFNTLSRPLTLFNLVDLFHPSSPPYGSAFPPSPFPPLTLPTLFQPFHQPSPFFLSTSAPSPPLTYSSLRHLYHPNHLTTPPLHSAFFTSLPWPPPWLPVTVFALPDLSTLPNSASGTGSWGSCLGLTPRNKWE